MPGRSHKVVPLTVSLKEDRDARDTDACREDPSRLRGLVMQQIKKFSCANSSLDDLPVFSHAFLFPSSILWTSVLDLDNPI